MEEITYDTVCIGIMVVMILMMTISIPTIFLTVRSSAKLIKKYAALRSIDKMEEKTPKNVLNEWKTAKSTLGYTSIIAEQIEKLNSLRPMFFQAGLAIILSIILGIWPGYDSNMLILFIVLDVIVVLTLAYAVFYINVYKHEYVKILKEVNEESDNGSADGMYG